MTAPKIDESASADLERLARQWGAREIPFQPHAGWLSTPGIARVLERLDQCARLRQTMLLSGPNGVGKSAVLRHWLDHLDTRRLEPVVLTQATLSASSLLGAIALKLGGVGAGRRERLLQSIEKSLAELHPRIPVAVLDEAQNYCHGALEEVRLLLGLNLPAQPAFALVLVGDDFLLQSMRLRHHRPLFSRLSVHVALERWSPRQAGQYLLHSLEVAGLPASSIEEKALNDLANASGGLPRSLQLLARESWILAAQSQQRHIDGQHVQQAIQNIPFVPGLHEPPPASETDSAPSTP